MNTEIVELSRLGIAYLVEYDTNGKPVAAMRIDGFERD